MELFVSALPRQEAYYVDFVCTDNGALNWLFKFQGERLLFKEPLKGLKGDVTRMSSVKETGRGFLLLFAKCGCVFVLNMSNKQDNFCFVFMFLLCSSLQRR